MIYNPRSWLARIISALDWLLPYRGCHVVQPGHLTWVQRTALAERARAELAALMRQATVELPVITAPQHPVVPLSVLMTGPASEPAEEHPGLAYALPQPPRLIGPAPQQDRALAGASS